MEQQLENKVAQSGLITINLEKHLLPGERVSFDVKEYLFRELLLKEKDFREALDNIDWNDYKGKHVAVWCSNDAIIPVWAFMLVAVKLDSIAETVHMGSPESLEEELVRQAIADLDIEQYRDKMLVIKGCGEGPVPNSAYLEITKRLVPVAKSVMYGEPCATVPLYKKPKK